MKYIILSEENRMRMTNFNTNTQQMDNSKAKNASKNHLTKKKIVSRQPAPQNLSQSNSLGQNRVLLKKKQDHQSVPNAQAGYQYLEKINEVISQENSQSRQINQKITKLNKIPTNTDQLNQIPTHSPQLNQISTQQGNQILNS